MLQGLQVKGGCAAASDSQVPKFLPGLNWHFQGLEGVPCRKTQYYKFLLQDLRNVLVVGGVSLECFYFLLFFLRLCRAWGILEVPDVRRQGTGYDRNQVGQVVCGNAKVVFAVGCLGNSSAAKRLWYSPFLEKRSSPCDWAGSQSNAISARCPGLPQLSQHLTCCQQLRWSSWWGVEGTLNWCGCTLSGLCTSLWEQHVLLWVTDTLLGTTKAWNPCQACHWGPWAHLAPAGHQRVKIKQEYIILRAALYWTKPMTDVFSSEQSCSHSMSSVWPEI